MIIAIATDDHGDHNHDDDRDDGDEHNGDHDDDRDDDVGCPGGEWLTAQEKKDLNRGRLSPSGIRVTLIGFST